jgi:hypothetical protein
MALSLVEQVMEEYRRRLLGREAEQMRDMARRWLEVERALEGMAILLAQEAGELKAAGKALTADQIYRMERYRRLIAQAKEEVKKYERWAADLIGGKQAEMGKLGAECATATIEAAYLDAGVIGAQFDRLPIRAVEEMAGRASDGSPLYQLLLKDYPETVGDLTSTLMKATAEGLNPRETARLMMEDMAGNLDRALTVARTEQLGAFREASRMQMDISGVVEGYIRRCALNDRTCMACVVLDGTEYPTDELMEVHPCDRCFMQPKVAGLAPVEGESGQRWFERQPEEIQRGMMGEKYYDAWRSGGFQLSDLAKTHEDPVWGPTVGVRPLSELIGERP